MPTFNITINFLTSNHMISVDSTKQLIDYKEEILKFTNFNIDSYIIKHQKFGLINWDFSIDKFENNTTIYFLHTIR